MISCGYVRFSARYLAMLDFGATLPRMKVLDPFQNLREP